MLSEIELKYIASELNRLQSEEIKRSEVKREYISQNESFNYKSCTRKLVTDWITSGQLKTFPRGNRKMIRTVDLDKLLKRPIIKL